MGMGSNDHLVNIFEKRELDAEILGEKERV
jgi:hypothetical protein